jgi:hypothetical protein
MEDTSFLKALNQVETRARPKGLVRKKANHDSPSIPLNLISFTRDSSYSPSFGPAPPHICCFPLVNAGWAA